MFKQSSLRSSNARREPNTRPNKGPGCTSKEGGANHEKQFMTKNQENLHPAQLILRCGQHLKSNDSNVFLIIHPERRASPVSALHGLQLISCCSAFGTVRVGPLRFSSNHSITEGAVKEMDYPKPKAGTPPGSKQWNEKLIKS